MLPKHTTTNNSTKRKSTGDSSKAPNKTKYGDKQGPEHLERRMEQSFEEDISQPTTQAQTMTAGASERAASNEVEEIESDTDELSKCRP